METSSFRQAIEAQFDCLAKKVIKRAVMKGYRDMKRREKRECSFSDLADYQQERFGECDKYASDYTVFNVLGIEVWVENDKLSEALKTLTEKAKYHSVILLHGYGRRRNQPFYQSSSFKRPVSQNKDA